MGLGLNIQQAPPIGHNQPFAVPDDETLRTLLATDHTQLRQRQNDLIAACDRLPAECGNDETAGKFGDYIKQVTACANALDAARETAKKPFLNAGRVVDSYFKGMISALDDAKKKANRPVELYLVAKAARERAERERIAKQAAEEAARAAAAMQTEGDLVTAVVAEQAAVEAVAATQVKAAELTRTYGAGGSTVSLRTTWEYEIENIDQIPRTYMAVNDAAIKAAIKAAPKGEHGRPMIAIPGIKIVERQSAVSR